MNSTALIELINNAALLLALGVLYDTIPQKPQSHKPLVRALIGFAIGVSSQ